MCYKIAKSAFSEGTDTKAVSKGETSDSTPNIGALLPFFTGADYLKNGEKTGQIILRDVDKIAIAKHLIRMGKIDKSKELEEWWKESGKTSSGKAAPEPSSLIGELETDEAR